MMYNVKFDLKKALSILFIFSVLILLPSVSSAEEIVLRVKGDEIVVNNEDYTITPTDFGGSYYTKTVQRTWSEWSSYKRVSDNVVVKRGQSGRIDSTKGVTFGANIVGSITGLSFSTNASITSVIGHSMTVNTPGTYYLAYRVYYNYESGIRNTHSGWSGQIINKNNYTVGIPSYGEFVLVRVR